MSATNVEQHEVRGMVTDNTKNDQKRDLKLSGQVVGSLPDSTSAQAHESMSMTIEPYQAGADEAYMNKEQRDHFKKILLQWKKNLMEEADRTVTDMKDEANHFPDPTDRATQEEEFSLKLRTRDRERKLIKKIDEALQAIQDEEYGYCEVCGIEIGIQRLEARPTATQCIDCKTLAEIKERQRSR